MSTATATARRRHHNIFLDIQMKKNKNYSSAKYVTDLFFDRFVAIHVRNAEYFSQKISIRRTKTRMFLYEMCLTRNKNRSYGIWKRERSKKNMKWIIWCLGTWSTTIPQTHHAHATNRHKKKMNGEKNDRMFLHLKCFANQ